MEPYLTGFSVTLLTRRHEQSIRYLYHTLCLVCVCICVCVHALGWPENEAYNIISKMNGSTFNYAYIREFTAEGSSCFL